MVSNEYEGMERTEFQEYLTTGDSELDKGSRWWDSQGHPHSHSRAPRGWQDHIPC